MIIDKTMLIAGNDIPFQQAELLVHQPKVRQIALLGEENFFKGCQYLNFSKDNLSIQDKNRLTNLSNFNILMAILREKNPVVQESKLCMTMVLSLLFPEHTINFLPNGIMLSKVLDDNIERGIIDENNFESFRNIVSKIFCLDFYLNKNSKKYNPAGPQAQALVKKFEQRQRMLNKLKGKDKEKEDTILYKQLSILAVGQQINISLLLDGTLFQLCDQYQRYLNKENYDIFIQARMAGAKDLQEVEHWMN